jgi:hypothetical protein
MSEQRGYWYIVTGLLIGLGLGMLYSWVISPAEYIDTTPASLRSDFKNDYRYMIAAAYAADGDLNRARARLSLLGDADIIQAIGAQAQQMLANEAPRDTVQILANLSEDLQAAPAPTNTPTREPTALTASSPLTETATRPAANPTSTSRPLPSPTQVISIELSPTPSPTSTTPALPTPIATATARPTRTPSPTPGQPFQLISQSTFCKPEQPGLLQIFVRNAAQKPAPGVEIIVTWLGSTENFYTGLKPDIDPGYADFQMMPGTSYSLTLNNAGTRITELAAPECTDSAGNPYPGGIRLEFQQP